MRLHKEGAKNIFFVVLMVLATAAIGFFLASSLSVLFYTLAGALFILLGLVIWFFRLPERSSEISEDMVISPADGKVVVIEKITEDTYFNDERIQISIFMSPLNVHVQWYPVNGMISYKEYYKGKYLVAWHPKSSTLNERNTTVIRQNNGREIMVKQIAGAVARRIISYGQEGDKVSLNEELGFIKFGSRIDLILPTDAEILIDLEQKIIGNKTVIAKLPNS